VKEANYAKHSPEAVEIIQKNGLLFAPGKASNAGGVATSGLK